MASPALVDGSPPPVLNGYEPSSHSLTPLDEQASDSKSAPFVDEGDLRPDMPTTLSGWEKTTAQFRANRIVRFVRKLGDNAVKKVEDVGIGLMGATSAIAEVGGGVGRTAVSGVGAGISVVEGGVTSAFGPSRSKVVLNPRPVDTVTEIDISGTVLKDLNRAIEVVKMKGTSNAESPLNTPWILLIFPIMPIAFMYTKTAVSIFLPPTVNFIYSVWTFFGWRFWFCLVLLIFLAIVIFWETVKSIEPLRSITLQVDVAAIKFRRKLQKQMTRQMPKIYKALDRIVPPFTAVLVAIDRLLTPRLGFSPLLSINAKFNGWIYDPIIHEVGISDGTDKTGLGDAKQSGFDYNVTLSDQMGHDIVVAKRDRGQAVVVSETGIVPQPTGGLEFDAERVSEQVGLGHNDAGEMYEQYFSVSLCLHQLMELHREYTSVWIEWMYRGMVVDRSVIRDVTTSDKWKGFGASFDEYTLTGEVRLPMRAPTADSDGGFFDVPIRLILKGRYGKPIYGNDGARRYLRGSRPISIIGELELSALRIGVGADPYGIVHSELRIPLHAIGVSQYRAAIVRASARITPVDNSSYSYRQMLSPLPNGEWTVRVNVFELRSLRGVDNSGSSDPFVKASVLGMSKETDRQRQTLTCMVNQLLFFSKACTGLEFEKEKIVIEVMDWNRITPARRIGHYTIDAKRILELPGQELYRKWLALQDPNGGKRPTGFIKLSVTVVPPGRSAPHHNELEDMEEFSTAKLLKNNVLLTPDMSYQNWAVHVTIGWADMLPRMATSGYRDAVRGYVTLDYSGFEERRTNTFITEAKKVLDRNIGTACRVLPQRRTIWNEEYVLPLTVINNRVTQEGITLKVMHHIMPRLHQALGGRTSDQLIGEVNVSFDELFKNMTTAVVRGDPADGEDEGDRIHEVALLKPRYYNFYGKPDGAADIYDKGVAFRGRLLVGVAAKPGDVPEPILRPCPPPPRPKLDFYKLTFCILRATELPLSDGWSVIVDCRIGLYKFGHTIPNVRAQNSCAEWDENCVVTIPNLQFPEDVEQIPDFFVTIWSRKPPTVAELEEKVAHGAEIKNRNCQQPGFEHESGLNGAVVQANEMDDSKDFASTMPEPSVDNNNSKDGTLQPKAFLRLSAKNLVCGQEVPRWMFMDYPGNNVLQSKDNEDASDNKVPGSILMSASLTKYDPTYEDDNSEDLAKPNSYAECLTPPNITVPEILRDDGPEDEIRPIETVAATPASGWNLSQPEKRGEFFSASKPYTYSYPLGVERSYTLRAHVWKGRNLPAADDSGLSDPMITVSIGDKRKKGKYICLQTITPIWEEVVTVEDIKIRDGERKPNVNVLIYDWDGKGKPMDYLGRCIIPAIELGSAQPSLEHSKWYPVFSVNPSVIVGEILADFQLIPTEVAISSPMRPLPSPVRSDSTLRISLVGLRDLKLHQYAAGDMFVKCTISDVRMFEECEVLKVESEELMESKKGTILQRQTYEANCNILDVLMLQIRIPEDLRLAPALNFFVYAKYYRTPKAQPATLVATGCVALEKWLSEHNRKLMTGESLVDDSLGIDAPVPQRLLESNYGYKFRRDVKFSGEEPIGAASLRLHEIKAKDQVEKNKLMLREKLDVLLVGFSKDKRRSGDVVASSKVKKPGFGKKVSAMFAPLRAVKFQVADTLADMMPDVATALGIEVEEEVPLSTIAGVDSDKIDYDGTQHLKRDRGFCPTELEMDLSEPAYGEFLLYRGDNRALGATGGRIESSVVSGNAEVDGQGLPPLLPLEELVSTSTLEAREKRRAALEGARPSVGKVKARLDLMELDVGDEDELKKVQMTSLRSFGRVFVPTEVVVRVYVLRGVNLQQIGSQCNPYLTVRFYGGYPDFRSQKHDPVMDNDNPNFFCMFESRVKMPGGCVRIEVKDRVLPEINVPVSYPMITRDDGKRSYGIVQRDIPINVGKLGLGWSEHIGETVIDLDARWYNSTWRALAKTPVERRSLHSEGSSNLKGQLELFVDMFDANDVDKRAKLYKPITICAPPQEKFEMRVVIYKISECMLPYKLVNYDPAKVAAFYVQARLGNRPEDVRKTDRCKYVADGFAEFNWRMKWKMSLPSAEIKPRLKLEVFDDTSHGLGDDQLCATVDIKLRSLFDDLVLNKKPIIKKKQWVMMHHPNYPDVEARVQVSVELTTEVLAAKKKCFAGRDGYKKSQHEDYILPPPFQPAAFSVVNPVPYFNYLIISTVKNLQWTLATVLLMFPFIPMFFQFTFMITPWQWYAAGGIIGLIVFIRLSMVSAARSARMQAEIEASQGNASD